MFFTFWVLFWNIGRIYFLFSYTKHLERLLDYLTVCSYNVGLMFQSEFILYSCMNVKELLAWNRHYIWRFSDCNEIWTYNHLDCKQTLDHLVKFNQTILASLAKLSVDVGWTKRMWDWLPLNHLNFGYCAYFEEGVPWNFGNYRV